MNKAGKRILLYGSAGAGKTTIASRLFSDLKIEGFNVALVNEWIKKWAIQGKFPKSHQQLFVFANQQNDEDEILPYVQGIVSDSPLLMNAAYSLHYGYKGANHIIGLTNCFEEDFPGIHIWITREHEFQQEGRYQTEEQADEIGLTIQRLMRENLPSERTYFDHMTYEQTLLLSIEYLRS